jgi:sulfur carrier protein ThiS
MKFNELIEATEIPENVTVEDILKMHDAARRAIALLNRIKDPVQRKKHASAVFKNLNKIKAMLMRLTEKVPE